MMPSDLTVFIVDDDPAVRDSLSLLLGVHDYRVTVFSSADTFLKAFKNHWQGCLLLDLRMQGMDGLELQQRLKEQESLLKVVIMSGHGNLDTARQAFRAGALDFLEKPLDQDKLLRAIAEAHSLVTAHSRVSALKSERDRLLANLTPREKEVMTMIVAGQHNRHIAAQLGISPRTVEVHKARVLGKFGIGSVAELVRLTLADTASPDQPTLGQ